MTTKNNFYKKKSSQVTSIFLVLLVSITILTQIKATEIKESIIVPKAKKERYEQSVHGDVIIDYYHWLKDKDWPKVNSAEIVNHLKEENQYAENYFSPYKVQEEKLIKEIKSRIIEEDETYPKKFDNYFYYRKFIKGGNHFIICRKKKFFKGRGGNYTGC
jgi:oligopeptidase B